MSIRQPFLPRFRAQLASYGLRRTLTKARAHTLSSLEALAGPALADVSRTLAGPGTNRRERTYPPRRVFWCFVWQMLNPQTSGREVVRQLQALLSLEGVGKISSSDSALCQAKGRLPLGVLQKALSESAQAAAQRAGPFSYPGLKRDVVVVDGSTTVAADTSKNQRCFPQSLTQAFGCGFPLVKFVVLFSLASGAILDLVIGNKHAAGSCLFRKIWQRLKAGTILLADRGSSDYGTLAGLASQGIDVITRLHQGRDPDARIGRRLGPGERLRVFTKPSQRPASLAKRIWDRQPPDLTVRLITIKAQRKGFRSSTITLATTLLDVKAYPRKMIEDLYLYRWRLELCLKDIKTTMGLETLRSKSPAMIEKEIYACLVAYNLIRWVIADVKREHPVPLERISFKGTVDAVRHFSSALAVAKSRTLRRKLYATLLQTLAEDLVPERPGRREPRALKRRQKPFPLLNKHRHCYREKPHRKK